MKRIIPIILLLCCILALASCKVNAPSVVSSDGNTYELMTDKDGQRLTDADGNIIVEKTDEEGNAVTEVLSDDYLIIQDDKMITPAYEAKILPDFEIINGDVDPLLENKEGTIQYSTGYAPEDVTDINEFINDVCRQYSTVGIEVGEVEDVNISGIAMKRFSMSLTDDDGTPLQAYCYIAESAEGIVTVTLTSRDGGLSSISDADAFMQEIEYKVFQ